MFAGSVFALILTFVFSPTLGSKVTFELDDIALNGGGFEGRVLPRSNAKNERSVWLFQDEYVKITFCLPHRTKVIVEDIIISNDGGVDRVLLKWDIRNAIGKFNSKEDSNWGFSWNNFYSTGQIGAPRSLPAGRQTVTIKVVTADCYGVELDQIVVGFDNNLTADDVKCPDDAKMTRSLGYVHNLSPNELIGLCVSGKLKEWEKTDPRSRSPEAGTQVTNEQGEDRRKRQQLPF